jgi:hypothetical protein
VDLQGVCIPLFNLTSPAARAMRGPHLVMSLLRLPPTKQKSACDTVLVQRTYG